MPLATTIAFATLDDLFLDPKNPRLGIANTGQDVPLPQEKILGLMRSWSLEELAVSFLVSGFWPQEAVILVKEPLYEGNDKLVVVEGNRRIAALIYLRNAISGNPFSNRWKQIAQDAQPRENLFTAIPFITADSRDEVRAFIGYRHVTGIKEWDPAEKAEYIARMVDEAELSFEVIRKLIGSQLPTVRRNYIAYSVLRQLISLETDVSQDGLKNRFSVLFLSLRTSGVQSFLGLNIQADGEEAKNPVKPTNLQNLTDFAIWLFGSEDKKPLFSDSRDIDNFGRILSTPEAVDYLRNTSNPSFELALQKAGIEEEETANQLKEANNQMELALSRVHLHLESEEVLKQLHRLALNAKELIRKFPMIAQEIGLNTSQDSDA